MKERKVKFRGLAGKIHKYFQSHPNHTITPSEMAGRIPGPLPWGTSVDLGELKEACYKSMSYLKSKGILTAINEGTPKVAFTSSTVPKKENTNGFSKYTITGEIDQIVQEDGYVLVSFRAVKFQKV